MDPFSIALTSAYLGSLGSTLSSNILSDAGRGIRRAISGEEIEQAFERCTRAGIVAVVQTTAAQAQEKADLLEDILDRFFREPDVGGELSEILNGRMPDIRELTRLFEAAGYDPETLPGIRFDAAVEAFAAVFLNAAVIEPLLQPVIQAKNMLEQTEIQREMLDTMREMAGFLREERYEIITVRPDRIQAGNTADDHSRNSPVQMKEFRIVNSQAAVIGDNNRINGGVHYHYGSDQAEDRQVIDTKLRYLKDLAAETNQLPWGRLAPDEAGPGKKQNLRLVDIYIGLDTTEMERMDNEDAIRLHFRQKEEMKRISAQEMIDGHSRLVLLGDPGSGKTTLVNFLTHVMACACENEDPDNCMMHLQKIGKWTHGALFPVRVVLRNFAEWRGGKGGEEDGLVEYLRYTLEKSGLEILWPDVHKALLDESEPVLVLLDGLDEVSADDRRGMVEIIDDFAERYPHNRYIVTCRIYAYVDDQYRLHEFRQAILAPFNEEQVKGFIHAWYAEYSRQGHLDEETAKEQAGKLAHAVELRDLMELAERPLLMTVMALLHTSYGQLPEDRIELYEWTVGLLFRRWKGHIGGGENSLIESLAMPQLRMTDLEAGLYNVAFDAHAGHGEAEGTADIPELTLLKGLKPYLGSFDKAEIFVNYVRERAGLLIRYKTDAYTFPHRTFQEFMAACHLVRMKDYPKEAARLVKEDPDRWRIVFVLAAGLARKHQPGNAIYSVARLCLSGVAECKLPEASDFVLADIGAEALLEIGLMEIERDDEGLVVLGRNRKWLMAAIEADKILEPKNRVYSGNLLSRLGDPRFNADMWFLPDEEDLGFVLVPEGAFLMGSDEYKSERPPHRVCLSEYWISRYPVTVDQFRSFVDASGQQPGDEDCLRGIGNHPVVWVSWHEAVEYCKWLTNALKKHKDTPETLAALLRQGWQVSLPSEAQWEKAARGTDGLNYPWGKNADPNRANYDETGIGGTSPVGCFPGGISPCGIHDAGGNVWEWCLDWFDDEYYKRSLERDPVGPDDGADRLPAPRRRVPACPAPRSAGPGKQCAQGDAGRNS